MKRKYDQAFKDEAVAIALNSDRPYSEIAVDLGVNYQTFGNWMRAAMAGKSRERGSGGKPNKQDYQSLERELRAAKKELSLRQKEIDLLKKAAAYFAREQA
ncbi:MAG: transposase [Pseudomonadales bacterium]